MSSPLSAKKPDLKAFDPSDNSRRTPKILTVPELVVAYLADLKTRVNVCSHAEKSYENTAHNLNRFAARFDQPISECRQNDLTTWINENVQWKAVSTKKRAVGDVITMFAWGLEEELVDRQPYRRPRILRGVKDKVRRPADPREYITLMRHGSRALRRALFILRRTGMRTCEMRELLWSWVHLDGDNPHLVFAKHKTVRHTGEPKFVGLDATTARFLRNLKRQCPDNDPHVFRNCEGGPWDVHVFARHLRRTAKRLGLDEGVEERVSGYCLRHTYVVDGIEAGISTRKIADEIGHASTRMIDARYGSHTRERLEHLCNVAKEIAGKRKKIPPSSKPVVPFDDGTKPA